MLYVGVRFDVMGIWKILQNFLRTKQGLSSTAIALRAGLVAKKGPKKFAQ
jgi:hypothetical protein